MTPQPPKPRQIVRCLGIVVVVVVVVAVVVQIVIVVAVVVVVAIAVVIAVVAFVVVGSVGGGNGGSVLAPLTRRATRAISAGPTAAMHARNPSRTAVCTRHTLINVGHHRDTQGHL